MINEMNPILRDELQSLVETYGSKELISWLSELVDPKISNKLYKEFLVWWDNFPANTGHGPYLPSRALRVNQDDCYPLWLKARKRYSNEQLINAIHKEVTGRKLRSVKENEMLYMQNTKNYLTNCIYESFMEDSEANSLNTTTELY